MFVAHDFTCKSCFKSQHKLQYVTLQKKKHFCSHYTGQIVLVWTYVATDNDLVKKCMEYAFGDPGI